MTSLQLLAIILLMGVVTYLPRMLPLVLLNNLKMPSYLTTFFSFIPYAVLGALIFPGILHSTGNTSSALFGGLIAAVFAFLRLNITLVILSGILGVYLFNLL